MAMRGWLRTNEADVVVVSGRGKVPALVRELIKDTRKMMSPFTGKAQLHPGDNPGVNRWFL